MMGWKQIYPKDCYRKMLVLSGETDISFPKVVNILVREGLIRIGEIPEEKSLAYLLKPKGFIPTDPRLETLKKHLTNANKNWDIMNSKAQSYWLKKAGENKQLPIAQEILKASGPK
ncbi:MAG: hypothetical protein OEY88_04680 [Candidatus Bathyarchaeota archaeon]|nr:hypothetical protein [Candidatus Bathyarchaeota archaeon]